MGRLTGHRGEQPLDQGTVSILVVCTANICRSPMGEALVRAAFAEVGAPVSVRSAGLLEGGRPASPAAAEVLRPRGLDITEHVSRRVDAELVEAADLVLVMERLHARELATLAPDALDRIHLLKALAAEADRLPGTVDDLRRWAEQVGAARPPTALVGDRQRDEVADPHGRSKRHHRAAADEIERAARSIARVAPRR